MRETHELSRGVSGAILQKQEEAEAGKREKGVLGSRIILV